METKTLGDIYDKRNNSFDDLRFILACLVLYVHSYALLYGENGGTDPWTVWTHFQLSPGTLAVYGFFVLSGFFMIQSWEATASLWQYTKNRILRIVPAFWLSLFVSSFVLVPLISTNSEIWTLNAGSSVYFFFKSAIFQSLGAAWTINGVFPNNPLADNINGSMWTLKYEVFLYFFLPVVLYFTHQKRHFILAGTVVLASLCLAFSANGFILFSGLGSDEYFKLLVLTTFFYYGVLLYLYKENIIVSKRLIVLFGVIFIASFFLGNLKLTTLFIFPYLLLVAGSFVKIHWFSRMGDYSYGMYIYAFPVQQTLVHFYAHELTAPTLFVGSFFITLGLSIASWHLVEKRVLRMKYKKSGHA